MEAQTITANTLMVLAECMFTRVGYTFQNWNTEPDGTGTVYEDGASMTLKEDKTLYAQWKTVVTAIRSVENTAADGSPACRALIDCECAGLTAYEARYDADGRFLGLEMMELQPGENELTVLRHGAAKIRFYVLDSLTWAPVCQTAEAPEL